MTRNAETGSGADPDFSESISTTLLDRVKSHDQAAWRQLVQVCGRLVYWWCRQSGLQADDAADVVQEVFKAVATHFGNRRVKGTRIGM